MDRAAIEELFAYTEYAWRQYADTIRPLGHDALIKPVPGSGWPALRNALCHLAWAYDKWISILKGIAPTGLDPESVRTWADIEDYRGHWRGEFHQFLDSLNDPTLIAKSWATSSDGAEVGRYLGEPVYSPADLLANVLLHDREHHGDLNTLLYQMGVEPPQTAYRFFLLETQQHRPT